MPTKINVPRRQEDTFVQYLCQRSCEMLNCELTLVLSCLPLGNNLNLSFIRNTTTLAFRCFVHSNPVKVSNYIFYLPSHFSAAFVGFLMIIQEESADLSHFYSAAGTSQIADVDDFGRLVLSINEEQESFDEWTEEDDFYWLTHTVVERYSVRRTYRPLVISVHWIPTNPKKWHEYFGQEKAHISRVFRERSRSVPVPLLIHSYCTWNSQLHILAKLYSIVLKEQFLVHYYKQHLRSWGINTWKVSWYSCSGSFLYSSTYKSYRGAEYCSLGSCCAEMNVSLLLEREGGMMPNNGESTESANYSDYVVFAQPTSSVPF